MNSWSDGLRTIAMALGILCVAPAGQAAAEFFHSSAAAPTSTLAAVPPEVIGTALAAGVIHLEVTVPPGTTGDVFVAGSAESLGPWNPAGLKLQRQPDGLFVGDIPGRAGESLEYKLTRGSWATVEKTQAGDERPNRVATFADAPLAVKINVDRWAADGPAASTRKSTVTGRLDTLEVASKILRNTRKVWVWLPPGYESATDPDREGRPRVYPVLYMADGRNLFDEATSAFGREWSLDETAAALLARNEIGPLIIVGIDHAKERIAEYAGAELGHGRHYGQFVVEELLPLISARYRTAAGPAHTFAGGSSLGGLVSLAMVMDFPDTFGKALVVSPSLWFEDSAILKRAEGGGVPPGKAIWLDIGTREGDRHVANARRLKEALEKQGVRVEYLEAGGAEHNEAAWAERAPAMLRFLLKP